MMTPPTLPKRPDTDPSTLDSTEHASLADAKAHEDALQRAMEEARELLPHEPEQARAILVAALASRPRDPGE